MDSDFVVGIDKSIDAAKGITGKEYPSYLHNTVVTEKLDELAEAIGEGSGGASALSDLTDVDISGSVQGGKVLKYNAVEEKWAPGDDSGNVQSDWNESDPTSGAFILNKPTIPDAQVQADWDESDSSDPSFIKNKPTIPAAQINSDWSETDSTSKAYIFNKPTIPDAQVQADWNESDTTSKAYIQNKPTIPADPGIPTPTASDIDKVIKVESDGQGGAQYTLGVGGSAETEIPGTLAAGASTVTLQNAAITTSSKIDYYAEVFGVYPINAAVTTGQIVLTYRPRATATGIKVVVS